MSRSLAGSVLVLLALGLACFASLVAHPTALIVDADHPSADHARAVDDPSIGNDLTRLFLPHHLAIARSIARLGHLPLWDDRGFGGRPLVGNPQGGLFYPPTWLAWISGVPSSLGWITVAHLLFSGLGAYRLGRTIGMSGWGALVAAGCVQASPYVLAQTFEGHYPHVWAACWYPWAFDATLRLHRGQPRSALALALILAATFLAGHPQEGYYLLLALGAWTLFEGLASIRARRWQEAGRTGAAWVLALVLAGGLIAVEVIPDVMAHPWTLRDASLSLRLAGRYHLYPVNALQLLSPRALGGPSDYLGHENYWESVTSIGLVPLVLACIAVAWSSDRRGVRGWTILALSCVLFASGRKLGLFALLYEVVPGMDLFRVPARSLFLASLGASMLAGMGVEALRERFEEANAWARLSRRVALLALMILSTVFIGGRLASPSTKPPGRHSARTLAIPPPSARLLNEVEDGGKSREIGRFLQGLARLSKDSTFLGALGATTLLIGFGSWRPDRRKAVAAALGLLGLVELGIHGHGLIVTTPVERFLGPDPIGEALVASRTPGLEPTRIRAVDGLYDDLRAGQAGFSKTNVYDSFQIQHAADLYRPLYDLFDDDRPRSRKLASTAAQRLAIRQAALDRMGISLLVADRADLEPWPLVESGRLNGSTFAIYRNPSALPRAYVVPRAQRVGDDASIVAHFPEFDPREVVLMRDDPLGPIVPSRQSYKPADWTSTDPDRIVLRVTTESPGLLVVAETWMPGWSAEVDGEPRPVLRGNRAQRVIPIDRPGRHEIILNYTPPGLTFGLGLTIASALTWSSLLVASIAHGPKRPPL